MAKLGGALSELVRGNADWEPFSFPAFHVGCRRRFARMQPDELRRYQTRKAQSIVRIHRAFEPGF